MTANALIQNQDMDLIEILWKQDIDLGVSREAFNLHENHELEKVKEEPEKEDKKEHIKDSDVEVACKLEKDNAAVNDVNDDFNYIIDSETGEHLIQNKPIEDVKSTLPFEDSLLSFDEFTSIFAGENVSNVNLSKQFVIEDEQLDHMFDDFDPEFFAAELEKLNSTDNIDFEEQLNELSLANEMYPSMEEYWQDISTTLPLSVVNQACVLPRPNRTFLEPSDDHSDQQRPIPAPQVYAEAVQQQHTALVPRSPEVNNGLTYLSPYFGPTSLGCAVASSIATLTNDTDPIPDVTAPMNATFGLDMPGMLPINQTTPQAPNDTMLSELFFDDDLQLMDVSSASQYHPEVPHRTVPYMRMFEPDPNSSDTLSSFECDENERMKFEELPSSCAGKEMIYGACKYPSNQAPMNSGLQQAEASPNNPNSAGGFHTPIRANYSCFQHNHTYHLPFSNSNNAPKPLTRDKLRHLSCSSNESNSRDEKRAKALELPISISEIINLAIDEFNEKLTKFELTEPQMTLIRDIRRRGKNKVAAQNCRKRKMDQISNLQQDLCVLHDERIQLESERTRLLHQRRNIRDKYSKLCQLVVQSASSSIPSLQDFPPSNQSSSSGSSCNSELPSSADADLPESDSDIMYSQGARSKRKIVKKS